MSENNVKTEEVVKIEEVANNVVDVNFNEVKEEAVPVKETEETTGTTEIPSADEFKKQAPKQFTTMDEAFKYELFTRVKQLKEAEDLDDYCIIDRFNSADFIFAFKDALNSYREDVILCERLYKKDLCETEKRQMYTLPEEARKISAELADYVKSISNPTSLTEEELRTINEKVKGYQEQLKAEDMQAVLEDTDVLVYKDGFGKALLVQPLADIDNAALEQHCGVIAKFALSYFLTMRYMFDNNFTINVTPVKSGDYIDVIAVIKLH